MKARYRVPVPHPRFLEGGNLSLREAPDVSTRRVAGIRNGENLLLLERTPEAYTVDTGPDGILDVPWYRVRTTSELEGWFFAPRALPSGFPLRLVRIIIPPVS